MNCARSAPLDRGHFLLEKCVLSSPNAKFSPLRGPESALRAARYAGRATRAGVLRIAREAGGRTCGPILLMKPRSSEYVLPGFGPISPPALSWHVLAWRLGGWRMRVALVVLSLATLASCLFTAKAGGAAEVDCSVCFANETLDVTAIPTNDTGAEEAEEAKQECRSNQSTQIMVVGGLTGGFMVAAICRRTRRPRKAPTRWTQTPTQTQQPRRKLSTHWLPAHTYLPPRGRKQHSVATNEQGMQTLPPPRSYEEGSQTFAVRQRTLTLTLTLIHP